MLTTIIIIAIIVCIGVVVNILMKSNEDEEQKVLKVNEVTRSVFYSPQYVAINEGFFKQRGIEIELTTGQGADAVMTSVLSNQCDIGFAGPEASIYVYNEGKEDYTQVFAQMTKKDGSFLVARENTDNFSWQDLKGKTVIPGRKGGVPYMTLEYVLKKNGINPETDLVLDDSIKFDLMAGAFSAGNADYVTLFEPTASNTQNQGKGYIVASVGEAAGEIPYTAYFAKKSYIENNEKIIQDFTDAVYEGQKWVKEHSSREIAESVQSFFPDTDLELLETVIQNYKDIDAWNDTPVLKEESFNRLQEVMTMAGELEKEAPYNKIVNNKYAEKSSNN
ncbi:MAG: ABC transporter substrate-binding protein [Candidatus Scatovivens sp.]